MRTLWIDQPEQLRDFCAQIEGDVIAFDTESDHFHAYQAQVCLIQVGSRESSALIDPLALDADELEPLFELLRDPSVVTILHAGRNDILEMDRDYGVIISNLFDTQIAAKFLGYERNSLSWLQEEIIGDKPGQYSTFDWTTRPIPPKAREYAAADVADLFALRDRFLPELEAALWLEPFHQQCAYVTSITKYEPSPFDEEGWRKIDRRKNLDGEQRACLRELYVLRHEICTEENRAALHIFPDAALRKIFRDRPQTIADLEAIRRLPDETIEAHGERILEALERSQHCEPPPERPPRKSRPRLSNAHRSRYSALKDWRNETSESLDLAGEFIATNATLFDVAEDPPTCVEGLDAFAGILPWHREMFGEEILEVIERAS
ncbi:hypothetical protein FIV42_22750 [Persicimonas caeni]|uniref:HRDC domain-containing protein n=1 Tax=Persicimonas caeni TaxID=2292766 RepID=A0A4Y6PZ60_PERCE|nr:HRDC domain-containing protein [Persicimonas caeni]QDG53459.1 hypothetical protein FIV42_22750 [Persicimonas caeni]QED34680.1 hypothetical protein FRD00_22745 [Persicimonas caeni]